MGSKGLRYAYRDGFKNLKRHPLIVFTSITTVTLMLFLLGAFGLFMMNANALLKQLGERPPVEIQFRLGVGENEVYHLSRQLEENGQIVEIRVKSPEDNLEEFKERIGKEELFDDFDYREHIPWTIVLRLSDPCLAKSFRDEVMKQPGVYDVMMETTIMEALRDAKSRFGFWLSIAFLILLLISILVISNMVRMIALSRSSELSIMKSMGATNRYIRIPFVIEGLTVGFFSALLALVLLYFAYTGLYGQLSGTVGELSFIPWSELAGEAVLTELGFSLLLTGLTSALSVRRHINV